MTLFTIFFLCFVSPVWRGYVISVLWGWYIVPTFSAVPLGVIPAIGVSLLIGLMTYQHVGGIDDKRKQEAKLVESMAIALILPLFILFFGWFFKFFM